MQLCCAVQCAVIGNFQITKAVTKLFMRLSEICQLHIDPGLNVCTGITKGDYHFQTEEVHL